MAAPVRKPVRKAANRSPIRKMSARPKFINPIIYSPPGGGKTILAGSSAEIGNTLILNADGQDGPESIRSMGYDPDIWDITSYKQFDKAYEHLRLHPGLYDWVWLDSITLYQETNIQEILADVRAGGKTHRDPDVPDKPEYLREQTKTLKTIRHMRALPLNFGITAHVMSMVDDDDGEVVYLPSIQGGQGRVSSKVCGYMSVVGYLKIVKVKGGDGKVHKVRRLITEFDGKWYAKDRFGALTPYVAQPTIAKIAGLVQQSNKGTRRSK